MAKPALKLGRQWWKKINTHPAIGTAVGNKARRIAEACGAGYVALTSEGQARHSRHRAAVLPVTGRARRDNARHNTLLANKDA